MGSGDWKGGKEKGETGKDCARYGPHVKPSNAPPSGQISFCHQGGLLRPNRQRTQAVGALTLLLRAYPVLSADIAVLGTEL